MNRLLIALAGLATVAAASPAAAVDRRFAVPDFDRVEVEGPYIVRLRVGGPSTATASGSQASLDRVTIDGSGRIELAGAAETLTADIQGSGDLAAQGLRVENANIQATTSGTIALAAIRSATVTALGLGTVEISGDPACTLRGPNSDLVRCGDQ